MLRRSATHPTASPARGHLRQSPRALLVRATVALAFCFILAGGALAPAALASSVSSVSVTFNSATRQVGAGDEYFVSFTLSSPLNAGDTVTVAGPAGTVFSGQQTSYSVDEGGGGYTLGAPPQVGDNGATVSLEMNPAVHFGAGARVTLQVANVIDTTTPGTYTLGVSTTGDSTPAESNSFTVDTGPPSLLTVRSGNDASAQVGQAFGSVLAAKLTDQFGNPISGLSVSFAASSSGASGTFGNGSSVDDAVTNSSGIATSTTFTANTTQRRARDVRLRPAGGDRKAGGPAARSASLPPRPSRSSERGPGFL